MTLKEKLIEVRDLRDDIITTHKAMSVKEMTRLMNKLLDLEYEAVILAVEETISLSKNKGEPMSMMNPQTLEEFFDVTNVDEELRPRYRKWLQGVMRRMIPKKLGDTIWILGIVSLDYKIGYNKALSDIKENIKKI